MVQSGAQAAHRSARHVGTLHPSLSELGVPRALLTVRLLCSGSELRKGEEPPCAIPRLGEPCHLLAAGAAAEQGQESFLVQFWALCVGCGPQTPGCRPLQVASPPHLGDPGHTATKEGPLTQAPWLLEP